MKKEIIPCY